MALVCLLGALIQADASEGFSLGEALNRITETDGGDTEVAVPSHFADAKWIWPHTLGHPTNLVVEFRREFVASQPSEAIMAIAADTVFFVSLNGGRPQIGRFPNVPPMQFYDVFKVGDLQRGTNVLCLSLYVQGRESFQYIPGMPGFAYELTGGGACIVSDANMKWRVSTADRSCGVPLVTPQLGFSFDYDANARPDDWERLTEADVSICDQTMAFYKLPVPRSNVKSMIAGRVVAQGCLADASVPAEIAKGMDATAMRPIEKERFFMADGRSVNESFLGDGFYAVFDLGREEAGLLCLDVETDAGVVVDIGHAEHMEDGRIRTAMDEYLFAGRYRTKEGRNEYCRWMRRMAGRFVQLHVRGATNRFKINCVGVKPVEYPIGELPTPPSLSCVEREIWKTCVRTLRLCMHEHYEDCPWREQALYANDARNQMLSGYYAFDSTNRMPELCIGLLAAGVGDDGWVSLCMPSRRGRKIPSFTFSWVLSVDDHLKFRQDRDFTRMMMPVVGKILDKRISELKDGLLPCPKGRRYWQFYDWKKDLDNEAHSEWTGDRYDAPLNLFCILAFEAGARCARSLGQTDRAARWSASAAEMKRSCRSRFWNAEARQVETRIGEALAPCELAQALALLTGVVPQDARAEVVDRLSRGSVWTETSLSQSIYKYEALVAEGGDCRERAYKAISRDWNEMLEAGATSFWEVKEGCKAFSGAASLCHGWSAIPVYFLGARARGCR